MLPQLSAKDLLELERLLAAERPIRHCTDRMIGPLADQTNALSRTSSKSPAAKRPHLSTPDHGGTGAHSVVQPQLQAAQTGAAGVLPAHLLLRQPCPTDEPLPSGRTGIANLIAAAPLPEVPWQLSSEDRWQHLGPAAAPTTAARAVTAMPQQTRHYQQGPAEWRFGGQQRQVPPAPPVPQPSWPSSSRAQPGGWQPYAVPGGSSVGGTDPSAGPHWAGQRSCASAPDAAQRYQHPPAVGSRQDGGPSAWAQQHSSATARRVHTEHASCCEAPVAAGKLAAGASAPTAANPQPPQSLRGAVDASAAGREVQSLAVSAGSQPPGQPAPGRHAPDAYGARVQQRSAPSHSTHAPQLHECHGQRAGVQQLQQRQGQRQRQPALCVPPVPAAALVGMARTQQPSQTARHPHQQATPPPPPSSRQQQVPAQPPAQPVPQPSTQGYQAPVQQQQPRPPTCGGHHPLPPPALPSQQAPPAEVQPNPLQPSHPAHHRPQGWLPGRQHQQPLPTQPQLQRQQVPMGMYLAPLQPSPPPTIVPVSQLGAHQALQQQSGVTVHGDPTAPSTQSVVPTQRDHQPPPPWAPFPATHPRPTASGGQAAAELAGPSCAASGHQGDGGLLCGNSPAVAAAQCQVTQTTAPGAVTVPVHVSGNAVQRVKPLEHATAKSVMEQPPVAASASASTAVAPGSAPALERATLLSAHAMPPPPLPPPAPLPSGRSDSVELICPGLPVMTAASEQRNAQSAVPCVQEGRGPSRVAQGSQAAGRGEAATAEALRAGTEGPWNAGNGGSGPWRSDEASAAGAVPRCVGSCHAGNAGSSDGGGGEGRSVGPADAAPSVATAVVVGAAGSADSKSGGGSAPSVRRLPASLAMGGAAAPAASVPPQQPIAGGSANGRAALPSIAEVRAAKAAAAAAAGGAVQSKPKLPTLAYTGCIRYAVSAVEVEWLCGQLMEARPPVIGFDMEWRPQYVAGSAGNPTALVQICYPAQASGPQADALHTNGGRGCCCLLLHVIHSGVTPRLRELLEAEHPTKVGVNITGDACKIKRDYGVEMRGLLELDSVANERVLQVIDHVTVNTEYRSRWSLAALVEISLRRYLPKPNSIRCGNWERRPLDAAQQRYAALDAYAGLAAWAALTRLPLRRTQPAPAALPPSAAAAPAAGSTAAAMPAPSAAPDGANSIGATDGAEVANGAQAVATISAAGESVRPEAAPGAAWSLAL